MAANKSGNPTSSIPGPGTDFQISIPSVPANPSAFKDKAIVVSLYGLPGSGKTSLLNQVKKEISREHFAFYEGSEVIASIVDGGLNAFKKLDDSEKTSWRERAIVKIRSECVESGKVGVVAGHFMFWSESEQVPRAVYTEKDLNTYTHILYLQVPAKAIVQQCRSDTTRQRANLSVDQIHHWQQAELNELTTLCRQHGILFSVISRERTPLKVVSTFLHDFRLHNEKYNLSKAENMLDETVVTPNAHLETVIVMDADRTMAAEDAGALFWKMMDSECKLKDLFRGPLKYSYAAFRQATLLYEEAADDEAFDTLCQKVANQVTLHPKLVSLLSRVAEEKHVGAAILTSGLRRVWEKVLHREGLSETVAIIGGGRIADDLVVTAAVKGALAARLREFHKLYVWAFGDSPLDLDMLSKADQAIVVVGDEQTRSKSMELALEEAIDRGGLRAHQVLLPANSSPRLNKFMLPLFRLTDHGFVELLFRQRNRPSPVLHATGKNAAKILMTPTRDAQVAGPTLRKAHGRIGRYLATEYLTKLIGVEEIPIQHVQGHWTDGYRLCHEKKTTIVALMRGGEPMALGVSDAFPLAMLIHAHYPNDITPHHLQGQQTIVLVDSVVNSGRTVLQFLQYIRDIMASVRVIIVAGVIQSGFLSAPELARYKNVDLIALRLSENKFTGKGTTDTGNRLFNTTHLE